MENASWRCIRNSRRSFACCRPCCCAWLSLCSSPARAADPATVTFSLDFPGSDPEHYSISVQSDGQARYECAGKISKDSDETESLPDGIQFFGRDPCPDFRPGGAGSLFFRQDRFRQQEAGIHRSQETDLQGRSAGVNAADYNYSPVPAVQQLTTLFQGVASTLEFGRRLAHYHRYQKLALDDELKRMESQARDGEIGELPAVKPILQEIYDDSSVINVVRARAQRIMEMGNAPPAR